MNNSNRNNNYDNTLTCTLPRCMVRTIKLKLKICHHCPIIFTRKPQKQLWHRSLPTNHKKRAQRLHVQPQCSTTKHYYFCITKSAIFNKFLQHTDRHTIHFDNMIYCTHTHTLSDSTRERESQTIFTDLYIQCKILNRLSHSAQCTWTSSFTIQKQHQAA